MSKIKLSADHIIRTKQGDNYIYYCGVKATEQMGDLHAWGNNINEAYKATEEKIKFIVNRILAKLVDKKTIEIIPFEEAKEQYNKLQQEKNN